MFVLPSWYPSRVVPLAGLFVREQVAALAALRPQWHIVVGLWGHHDGALSLRSAGASARALAWRVRQPGPAGRAGQEAGWRSVGGWHEVTTPRLSWTLAWRGGGVQGLLSASRRNLQQAVQRFGPMQLLHAHVGFPAGWIASQLAAEVGVPYVLTEHMSPFPVAELATATGLPNAALRMAFERAAATVAVSQALADRIRACGLPCSDVVPNAVDDSRFALTPPPSGRPFVFFTLANLTPQKGVDVLLQALALWRPAPGTVELHIGGSGPQQAALQKLAQTLGVAGCVRWLGALRPADTPAHFARCHAFVLASRHETFGVVLAEALMCGRPVLATRCGGPVDIVHAGNGLLVPAQDPAALAQGLAALHRTASGYDRHALRADAIARFSRHAVALQLVALYQRVLGL